MLSQPVQNHHENLIWATRFFHITQFETQHSYLKGWPCPFQWCFQNTQGSLGTCQSYEVADTGNLDNLECKANDACLNQEDMPPGWGTKFLGQSKAPCLAGIVSSDPDNLVCIFVVLICKINIHNIINNFFIPSFSSQFHFNYILVLLHRL